MQIALLIGLGAGIASAVLFASAWTGTMLGMFVLFFLSPMPVSIAALGWGWGSSTLAVAVGAIAVAVPGGVRSGFIYLIALAAPAAVFSYLALLNRASDDHSGGVEWYPIGRIISWASLWAGLLAAAAILSMAGDADGYRDAVRETLERSMLLDSIGPGGAKLTPEQKESFVALMVLLLPWAIATLWFAVAMLNMWAGAHVTFLSGRLSRPWPDFSALSLPPGMQLAFGAAVFGTMLSGMPGVLASGFASALVFAYMLVGLGVLHRFTRGHSMRPMVLAIVYVGLMFLSPFSSLAVAFVGLAEPFLRPRIPPPPAGS